MMYPRFEAIRKLFRLYNSGKNIDAQVIAEIVETYMAMLKDVPDEVLAGAINKSIQTCKFFPTIAEIRENAREFLNAANPNAKSWAEVEREIRAALKHHGLYNPPTWSCPIVKELMKDRWLTFLEMETSQEGTVFAQTRQVYEGLLSRYKTKVRNSEALNGLPKDAQEKLKARQLAIAGITERVMDKLGTEPKKEGVTNG